MTLEQGKINIQAVPVFPDDDIILEILLRLPVKSLLRCKSVCKSWLSLISDPVFIKSHLKLSSSSTTNALRRLIYTDRLAINLKSCPLNDVLFQKSVFSSLDHVSPSHIRYNVAGSCNGLVCIVCFHPKHDKILFIWNPCTRISTTLYPSIDVPPAGRYDAVYGFAYDKATDDYKIVAVSRCDKNKVKMYSLKARDWKQIGDFPYGYPLNTSGVFSNGFLHWMATPTLRGHNGPIYNGSTYPCTIVYLDIASETYGEVSQPVYDEGRKLLTLGALGEWLCVLCNYPTFADVWVMKVYVVEDSWTKLVSVSHPNYRNSPYYLPLFISNDGTILLKSGWDLVVCDSNDGSGSKIKYFGKCINATTFVESLVSPHPSAQAAVGNNNLMIDAS